MSYILFVEDNPADIFFIKRIFKKEIPHLDPMFITDGEEAVSFIKKANQTKKLPLCIFLDIKIPKKNGIEILRFIRIEELISEINVLILSSSDRMDEKKQAFSLGCNDYIEKPKNFNLLKKELPLLVNKWSKACQ